MPPSLAELQGAVAARILGRDAPGVEDWVRVPDGVDVATRLAVYTQGYAARVSEALREAFPAVAYILGGASFASLAARYAREVPAGLRNLNHVGAALPAFLADDRLSRDLPFLSDLARLEWAVVECFHGELREPFDVASCSAWDMDDWANARVALQASTAIVRSAWPLRELRDARNSERSAIDVDLVERPDCVLVYRSGFEVVTESIGETEASALVCLRAGQRLGEVAAALDRSGAESDVVSGLFRRCVALGLVVSCRPSGSP